MTLETHTHNHSHIRNPEKHLIVHSKKSVKIIDRLVNFVAILSPALTLPQVWQVWSQKDAAGLSLITWISWVIFALFWLAYGVAHEEKPIIVTNLLWISIEIAVIAGIFLYS